jgi:hypothetical protein
VIGSLSREWGWVIGLLIKLQARADLDHVFRHFFSKEKAATWNSLEVGVITHDTESIGSM